MEILIYGEIICHMDELCFIFWNVVYISFVQSPQEAVTAFQILGGEAQIVQVMEYGFLLFLETHADELLFGLGQEMDPTLKFFFSRYSSAYVFLLLPDNVKITRKGRCKTWYDPNFFSHNIIFVSMIMYLDKTGSVGFAIISLCNTSAGWNCKCGVSLGCSM